MQSVQNSKLSKDMSNFMSVETCVQYIVFWANTRSLGENVNNEIDKKREKAYWRKILMKISC